MRSFFLRLLVKGCSAPRSVLVKALTLLGVILSVGAFAFPASAQIPSAGDMALSALCPGCGAARDAYRGVAAYTAWTENNAAVDWVMDMVDPQRVSVDDGDGGTGATTYETRTNATRRALVTAGVLPPSGQGSITDQLTARLVGFIAFMMGVIVSFLGKIILLLVNVLLGFLSYNGFVNAPPVVIGWKMVRDVANMFFIVILIISSYATILGWRSNELHVKSILPKVLLSAVLVNFSKTLVGLLIDASQVVMLTFVNAFAAIGAGNFTNAFHLPLITRANYATELQNLTSGTSAAAAAVAASGPGQVIIDVLLASGLQIFLLVVAIGVILMMVVFVAARIVGLWMLLVFSPIPFLASSLPSTISSKVLGKKANQFWDNLSGLLTGGPIMAFWLWLTFATLSAQGADERLGLFQNASVADPGSVFGVAQDGASMFLSAIGNAQGLGSYVVAIAMMLMGLEAAMDAAASVPGPAGGLMKNIGNKARDYAQRAALFAGGGAAVAGAGLAFRGGKVAGKATASLAGRGVGAFAGAVDRRFDLRTKMAALARKVPFAGQNEWLRKQQFANREQQKKNQAEYEKILSNPNLTEKEKKFEIDQLNMKDWIYGDKAAVQAIGADIGKKGMNEKAYDAELKTMKDENKNKLKAAGLDDRVAKAGSDRLGKAEAIKRQLTDIERAKAMLPKENVRTKEEKELAQKYDDAMKKIRKENPHLIDTSTAEGRAEYDKQMKDARQNFNSLDADAKGNFDVMRHMALAGAFKEEGGKIKVGDATAIKNTRKMLQGDARTNFDKMVTFMRENEGIDAAQMRNYSIEQDAQNNSRVLAMTTDASGAVVSAGYQTSKMRLDALQPIERNYTESNAAGWVDRAEPGRPVFDAGHTTQVVNASKTVGVSEVVQSVAKGATGAGADEARNAAANTIATHTGTKIAEAGTLLREKTKSYTDTDGKTVEKTYGEILRDQKAPLSIKDQVSNEYQKSVNEVLPILEGVDELPQAQQVEFMAKMGEANVGQALDNRLMNDPEQRATMQKVKAMVNENAQAVESWFGDKYATAPAEMQALQAYYDHETENRAYTAQKQQVDEWYKRQGRDGIEDLEAIAEYDDDSRKRFFNAHPEQETKYNEYKKFSELRADLPEKGRQLAATGAKVSAGLASVADSGTKYTEFKKYTAARSAVRQFNTNPGRNSATDRQRGGSRPPRTPRAPKS